MAGGIGVEDLIDAEVLCGALAAGVVLHRTVRELAFRDARWREWIGDAGHPWAAKYWVSTPRPRRQQGPDRRVACFVHWPSAQNTLNQGCGSSAFMNE